MKSEIGLGHRANEGLKDHRRYEVYRRLVMIRLCIPVLMITFLVWATHAESARHLWVLQEPNEIVAYDMGSFAARRTIKVPHRLFEAPEYLSINSKGLVLFLPPHGVHWASGEMALAGDRVWFWDGHQAKEWSLEGTKTRGSSAGKSTLVETMPQCFLSVGGEHLFWFENRFEKVTDDAGVERSVRSTSRVWRADLAGDRPETITSFSPAGWCQCATGACSETCPERYFWAPDGVVGDFFLVTRFTPGQLGSRYHESLLYQRSARTWQAKKLPQPIEKPLTASEKGEVLVAAVPDGGCCGWDNDGNDQTLLMRSGKVSMLFDEFKRYGNRNYDVSFFTSDARLASGNATVAYTVVSTARTDSEIRLSSNGKENAEELARVRRAIAELPAVEVVRLASEPEPKTTIHHASLVGWLSEHEIIVAQDGRLVVFDIHSKKRRETTIRVRNAADAFLR
ncbi:MAG TPA: hypothetical protein VLK23_10245 [Thermodesulfobacteriota bacterium]|nr:hypothetical protein [Thermodesulfobacteriota bacterium]